MINIRYYIIHCKQHTDRTFYVDVIKEWLGKPSEIFYGIYTKYVSLPRQLDFLHIFNRDFKFDDPSKFKFYLPGQIGCYLSHFKLLEKILTDKNNNLYVDDYSVIFEDDVTFDSGLHNQIEEIINNLKENCIDFDLIYLGNNSKNYGEHIVNNIYKVNPLRNCWGTHALLINNKNIEKLYYSTLNIKHEIDSQYKLNICDNIINGLVVYPSICGQKGEWFKSHIKEK